MLHVLHPGRNLIGLHLLHYVAETLVIYEEFETNLQEKSVRVEEKVTQFEIKNAYNLETTTRSTLTTLFPCYCTISQINKYR
jgi:hypothetical protein